MRTPIGAAFAVIAWALTSWGFAPAVNRQLAEGAQGAPEIGLALSLTAFNAGIAIGSAVGGVVIATAGPLALPGAGAAILTIALPRASAHPTHART